MPSRRFVQIHVERIVCVFYVDDTIFLFLPFPLASCYVKIRSFLFVILSLFFLFFPPPILRITNSVTVSHLFFLFLFGRTGGPERRFRDIGPLTSDDNALSDLHQRSASRFS